MKKQAEEAGKRHLKLMAKNSTVKSAEKAEGLVDQKVGNGSANSSKKAKHTKKNNRHVRFSNNFFKLK